MTQARGWPNPFGPIEGPDGAGRLARLSGYGFALASGVSLIQAAAVWVTPMVERQGVAGFSIFLAVVTGILALIQIRRPNRFLPVLGIAWALYELSAFVTSALVGAPLGAEGVPVWSPYLSAAAMGAALILHIGGLRGAAALLKSR